jgi:nicotinamide-nucleotide amidase
MSLQSLTEQLAEVLQQHGWMLASAESCTGGLIAAHCTDLPGSSNWFERGFVTYSNDAKHEMLGVDNHLIEQHGAVSKEVVEQMVLGALRHSRAQVTVATSGIAGPTGASADKPVGTVWFAWATPSDTGPTLDAESAWVKTECLHLAGDRAAVREAAVQHAMHELVQLLSNRTA